MDFFLHVAFGVRVLSRCVFFLCLFLSISVSYGAESDVECLKSIKASLEDPFGYLSSSWVFDNTTEGFICKFIGVECWHIDENKVLNLNLADFGLKGKFPRGIENCTSLTGLDLSSNKLYGTIPSNISKLLPFGVSLDLSSNNFSGAIPEDLSNCVYLNNLRLDSNQLRGQIPLQLGLLSRIKTFSVANNLLSGQIPLFTSRDITKESFANNRGLCGYYLGSCKHNTK